MNKCSIEVFPDNVNRKDEHLTRRPILLPQGFGSGGTGNAERRAGSIKRRYAVTLLWRRWTVPLHLLTCLGFCKFSGDGRFESVRLLDRRIDFVFELFPSGDRAVEALFRDYRQLNLGRIQPAGFLWSVVKLKSGGQFVSLFRAEHLVKRSGIAGARVVLDDQFLFEQMAALSPF